MIDFTGKTLVLTGANGGITRSVARVFYELGANMVLSDLDGDGISAFGRELDRSGARIATMAHDVAQSSDADAVVRAAADRFGGIDFLVTGAGLYRDQLVETMTDEKWTETIAINLDGVFYTCRAAAPKMRCGREHRLPGRTPRQLSARPLRRGQERRSGIFAQPDA